MKLKNALEVQTKTQQVGGDLTSTLFFMLENDFEIWIVQNL